MDKSRNPNREELMQEVLDRLVCAVTQLQRDISNIAGDIKEVKGILTGNAISSSTAGGGSPCDNGSHHSIAAISTTLRAEVPTVSSNNRQHSGKFSDQSSSTLRSEKSSFPAEDQLTSATKSCHSSSHAKPRKISSTSAGKGKYLRSSEASRTICCDEDADYYSEEEGIIKRETEYIALPTPSNMKIDLSRSTSKTLSKNSDLTDSRDSPVAAPCLGANLSIIDLTTSVDVVERDSERRTASAKNVLDEPVSHTDQDYRDDWDSDSTDKSSRSTVGLMPSKEQRKINTPLSGSKRRRSQVAYGRSGEEGIYQSRFAKTENKRAKSKKPVGEPVFELIDCFKHLHKLALSKSPVFSDPQTYTFAQNSFGKIFRALLDKYTDWKEFNKDGQIFYTYERQVDRNLSSEEEGHRYFNSEESLLHFLSFQLELCNDLGFFAKESIDFLKSSRGNVLLFYF